MDKNRLSVSVFHGYNSIGMKRAFQALPTVNSERPKILRLAAAIEFIRRTDHIPQDCTIHKTVSFPFPVCPNGFHRLTPNISAQTTGVRACNLTIAQDFSKISKLKNPAINRQILVLERIEHDAHRRVIRMKPCAAGRNGCLGSFLRRVVKLARRDAAEGDGGQSSLRREVKARAVA